MKKIFTLLFISISFAAFSQVRISQVYGAGGNSSATYNADFVELFNPSASPVNLSGYSIQYASATGTAWQAFALPATSLVSGQYFLIQMSAAGAVGATLPTPDAAASPAINMSGTAGKVALVNATTALSGTQCPPPFIASIVDYVGYGTTANCFEGTGPTPAPGSNANSLTRINNGCTDNNDNASDFTAVPANPRNTISPLNPCGAGSPALVAGPNITNITTSLGIASAPQTFTLTGYTLTGFPGNIPVTASANFEVSLTSGSGYATSINVPFTSASLPATTIYVRISAAAPQGALTGTVTCTGAAAGAPDAIVNLGGGVYQNYYNTKANLGLTNTGTWSTTTNGTGAAPANFTDPYLQFNIINQANANYTGVWDVSGTGNSSRVVVGDGTAALSFTILPGVDSVTSATRIDVLNNAKLIIQNNRRPFLNNLATGSTVDFAQTGTTATDTIRIPALSYYNLKLTGGLKYFSANTTTIRGDITADGVVSMNGSSPTFSTINAFGNLSVINGSKFESLPSGDGARITLAMNGTNPQNITGGPDTIYLFRLQRDTITSNSTINLTGKLSLGNNAGGGLRLNQGASTTTQLNMMTVNTRISIIGGAVVTTTSNGKISASGGAIDIAKAAGTTNAGTLRFASGAILTDFLIDCGPSFANDSITVADDIVINGTLFLTKGKIVMASGKKFSLQSSAVVTGGSATSFVDGILSRAGATAFTYHVGKGNKYAPVNFTNITGGNSYDVQYFNPGYGTYTINPTTLASFPNYNVSKLEWWKIDQASAGSVDLKFNYTDVLSQINVPAAIRMAHFGVSNWNDLGGTAGVTNTTTSGYVTVTGVSSFSPFTFSATAIGVIPVKLNSFTAQKLNNSVKLNWTTEQEMNSKEFIVERSVNGTSWSAIANIPAAGNSSTKISYTATDNAPVKGINFYRLRETDLDGRFDYSETKSVLFNTLYEVLITPNPAKDLVNIYIDNNNNRSVNIQLADVSGKIIQNITTGQPHVQMNTSGIGRGLYFIKVTDEGNITTSKIILL